MKRKIKTLCMFCIRSHVKKPKLCEAKSEVFRSYLKQGLPFWKVMYGVESGIIKLEAEALEIVHKRKRK